MSIYDRLDLELYPDRNLSQKMWRRREIENYLCHHSTLIAFAEWQGRQQQGDLFAAIVCERHGDSDR